MTEKISTIVSALVDVVENRSDVRLTEHLSQIDSTSTDGTEIAQAVNAAFLIALAGPRHPAADRASRLLEDMAGSGTWAEVGRFYRNGIDLVREELRTVSEGNGERADCIRSLAAWLDDGEWSHDGYELEERLWSLFFPEGTAIRGRERERIESLRHKRTVTITDLNADPVVDPPREILFTSNVLLTVPPETKTPDDAGLSAELSEQLRQCRDEPQLYWYDHPIPIGVAPENNEVLYGLRGLDEAVAYECSRRGRAADTKLTCALSVSVTHDGLHSIAKTYLREEFARAGGFRHLNIYLFTETDTKRIISELLVPAARHYLSSKEAGDILSVFGVDGRYGRHYSFLKAIAPLWSILVEPDIKATFKIDLDQVFPQPVLADQAGATAFEHLATPLWGARGRDASDQLVELGMIAGALVNERDIGKSLFTPDVTFPSRALAVDEYVFFSTLPQALSTEAEMMARYESDNLDGRTACLQRIHVTGGTNGILVDSLCRHRPFTPSFIGRAEDQAYLLSAFLGSDDRLAYLHKPGLIMRHDKEAFVQEAIQAAHVGKLIGDYERILYFSKYANVLDGDTVTLKDAIDPFTGCFVSHIPITVVMLRFALKAASLFAQGKRNQAHEFIALGARRIAAALDFVRGEDSQLRQAYQRERAGWDLYYDTLAAIEEALRSGDEFAVGLREKAGQIVSDCKVE